MTRSTALRLLPAAAVLGVALVACTPEGYLDSADVSVKGNAVTVAGWAWDRDVPTTPIDVHVYIDGSGMVTRADKPRPDVAAARPGAGENHGYSVTVNVSPGRHQVCTYAINYPGTGGENTALGCRTIDVSPPPPPLPPTTTTTRPPTTTTTRPPTTTTTRPPTTTTTTPTTTTTTPSTPATWQTDLIQRINASRTTAGVGKVTRCTALDTAAQSYAAAMAANRWFDTTGPDGSQPWTRVEAYGGTSVGENISYGFDSPTALHESQMGSDTQKDNVLRAEFTHVGVGRTQTDPDGSGPEPATYFWTVEFGTGGSC